MTEWSRKTLQEIDETVASLSGQAGTMTITHEQLAEAAMQDDVERVARLIAEMRQAEIGADWGNFDDYTEEGRQYALNEARAAMAVTREIDAEDLRELPKEGPEQLPRQFTQNEAADWLQQRANDVKETGRG